MVLFRLFPTVQCTIHPEHPKKIDAIVYLAHRIYHPHQFHPPSRRVFPLIRTTTKATAVGWDVLDIEIHAWP